MRRLAWLVLPLSLGCADFQTALSECEQSGRCEASGMVAKDGGGGGSTGGADAGQDAGENTDAGCVDLDLDGLGPGCAQPDCDDTDGQRPLQLPCRQGAFVCQSCPGASDLNSGAADSPLATIAAGISYARALKLPRVSVANESQYRTSVYTGSFDMVSGVSVVGRHYFEDGGFLYPSAVRTVIHNDTANGLLFPPGVGRDTVLSGFQVRSVGGDGGSAITIRGASPTLDDVIAGYPLAPAARSIGIRVQSPDPSVRAAPLLKNSGAHAVAATDDAIGIHVSDSMLQMQGGYAHGGAIGDQGTAVGLRLRNAAGSTVTNTTVIGCLGISAPFNSGSCTGIRATGEVSGISVGGAVVYGSLDLSPTNGEVAAIELSRCGDYDGGAPATVGGNTLLLGAVQNSNDSLARGVWVREGCAANIVDNNRIQGSNEVTASSNVIGLQCSKGGGADPVCSIRRNRIRSHAAGTSNVAFGVYCGCPTCDGGCVDIVDNEIDAFGGTGGTYHALAVTRAAPLVARNRVNLNHVDTPCTYSRAALFSDSTSRVENNFFHGGSCQNAIAVVVQQLSSNEGPTLHSNSLVGGESNESNGVGIGIYLTHVSGAGLPPFGRFINNIISSGNVQNGNIRHPILLEIDAAPVEVRGNLLHAQGSSVVAYTSWGNGNTPHTLASFNALPFSAGNLEGAPAFVSWRDLHLTDASPANNAGSPLLGPVDDIDGEQRRFGFDGGIGPSIGADQR